MLLIISIANSPNNCCPQMLEWYLREGGRVSTGWPCVDKLYRVVPGELCIVTGGRADRGGHHSTLVPVVVVVVRRAGGAVL